MSERPRTLTEACASVLLYLTTFRRNAQSSTQTIEELRTALLQEFERARRTCDEDPRLRPLFERVHYALVAAADQVVLSSAWPQRAGWTVQLLEMRVFQTAEGGKRFFRFVDEVLEDPGEGAVELAELLFTCMALGFQGELIGEPREIERRRRQLYEKARLPGKLGERLTPEAYGRDVPRRMPRLPTLGILRLALIALVAMLFAVIVGSVAPRLFSGELTRLVRDTQAAFTSR